ncbi:putative ribosome-binding factor A, mitochondrial isoform X3 [Bacillus rossius redtenbacheri]|uniref:putative ribosome-binding factor A, mitochondrial isoform X3 n=1 Tax=Bacillus rossius redtenbacheri TaxID=93214 RepID=UPI002FDE4165
MAVFRYYCKIFSKNSSESILDCCLYSTRTIIKKSHSREKRILEKMIRGSVSKKRPWYEAQDVRNASLPVPRLPFSGARSSRRAAMLNKVFMRQITDLMATGEVAGQIVGRGIQVKVSEDFKSLSVYWLSQSAQHDAEIERMLVGCAGHLRHELSQMQVVGVVPHIEFVKDRQFTKLLDVDHLLTQADYGDDYVPVHPHYHYNANFIQNAEFSPSPSTDKPLPPMRMDVLGLDHAIILTKIQRALKKAQAPHRKDPHLLEVESRATDADPDVGRSGLGSSQTDKLNLSTFLIKRQAAREKALRKAKSFRPEMELYEAETLDSEKYLENFLSQIDDVDFMADDDDDEKQT